MRKFFLVSFLFAAQSFASYAQSDKLLDELNAGAPKTKEPVTATFKATRIINSSSVENLAKGVLDFRILHRFGRVSDGTSNAFGFDNATTRIGLDYGVTKWLMVGIGHNTLLKANDGMAKVKLLSQKTTGMPITLSYYGGISVNGGPKPTLPAGMEYFFSHRMAFSNQILIARKFSKKISFQLMPTMIHHNLVDSTKYSNNTFAIGAGGRIKVTRSIAITGEYFFRANNTDMLSGSATTYNSFSIGADIETGGHVFQLFFSNSNGMTEPTFVAQTTDSWEKGQIHFGFNISRVFTIVKPKEFRSGDKKEW